MADALWRVLAYLKATARIIFYLAVIILCIAGGAIANPRIGSSDIFPLKNLLYIYESHAVFPTLIAILFFFICYLVVRLLVIDPPPAITDGAKKATLGAAAFFYAIFFLFGLYLWYENHLDNFWLVVFLTFPCAVMLIWSGWAQRSRGHPFAHKFLPKIFYPAFSICFLSFCLGWIMADTPEEIFRVDKGSFIIGLLSALIVLMFWLSYRRTTPGAVASAFSVLFFVTLTMSWIWYDKIGFSLVIALLWAFALGVAEVAKRGYLLRKRQVISGTRETLRFYVAGSNWSSILFFNLLLLMPILTSNAALSFVVVVAWPLMIWWHVVRNKATKKAYLVGLAIGYILPLGIIGLFLIGKIPNIIKIEPGAAQTDRLITLLGVFLTIVFILYHDDYRAMQKRLRASPDWFLSPHNCLLFAALTVALEAVLLTMIFTILIVSHWVDDRIGQVEFQVDLILIELIVELIAVLILLFVMKDGKKVKARSKRVSSRRVAVQAVGSPAEPQAPLTDAIGLIHPLNSSIAGFLALVFSIRLPGASPLSSLAVFVSAATLCMVGYVTNDIFDQNKDALARRGDKPVALGTVSRKRAVSLATALALISLASAASARPDVLRIVTFGLLLVLGYSYFARSLPKLKGLYTGVLCCLPVVIGAGIESTMFNTSLFAAVAIFIFGRETIIDITDMQYDRLSGHSTLALALGRDDALVLGWLGMLASIPFIVLIQTNAIGQSVAILAGLSLVAIFALCGFQNAPKVTSLSRIPMLLTISSLIFE